jgi:hypothetical protein
MISMKRTVYVCVKCGNITLGCFAWARMTKHLLKHLKITIDQYHRMEIDEWEKIAKEYVRGFVADFVFSLAPKSEKELTDRQKELLLMHAKSLTESPSQKIYI